MCAHLVINEEIIVFNCIYLMITFVRSGVGFFEFKAPFNQFTMQFKVSFNKCVSSYIRADFFHYSVINFFFKYLFKIHFVPVNLLSSLKRFFFRMWVGVWFLFFPIAIRAMSSLFSCDD